MELPRSRRGQIVMPALFIFPSLMLFVFLIFETAKLSREKIRHQFAIDAAVFVEMTNYSDFLNRSAYVNGAFPMRIFYEAFHDTPLTCDGKDPCPPPPIASSPAPMSEILYNEGIYPRSESDPNPDSFAGSNHPVWDIVFGGKGQGKNTDDPQIDSPLNIISEKAAEQWWLSWDDATTIYKLYVQIYQLLGSVESAQFSVLTRLAREHNFLKKSYWLNIGGDQAVKESIDLMGSFSAAEGNFPDKVKFHCAKTVYYAGNKPMPGLQPYQIFATDPPVEMADTISDCSGLFQLATVDRNTMRSISAGWPVQVHWAVPHNYFNVEFNNIFYFGAGPLVHARAAIGGFGGAKPAVWHENNIGPTPKFQVRTYP